MDASTSIARTYDPKYTTYRGDGQGRDSYVFMGNGGLVAPGAYTTNAPQIGYQRPKKSSTLYINQPIQQTFVTGSKEATAFKYFGDGSGRDSYVITDCGGLIPKYSNKGPQADFYNSLRQPDFGKPATSAASQLGSHRFFRVNCRGERVRDHNAPWFSSKTREAIRRSYQAQLHQVRRLSAPKTARVKFVDLKAEKRLGAKSVNKQTAQTSRNLQLAANLAGESHSNR